MCLFEQQTSKAHATREEIAIMVVIHFLYEALINFPSYCKGSEKVYSFKTISKQFMDYFVCERHHYLFTHHDKCTK